MLVACRHGTELSQTPQAHRSYFLQEISKHISYIFSTSSYWRVHGKNWTITTLLSRKTNSISPWGKFIKKHFHENSKVNTPRKSIEFIHEEKFIKKHLQENSKVNIPREYIEFIHEGKFIKKHLHENYKNECNCQALTMNVINTILRTLFM
jgi:hypothetical protein